MEKFSMASLRLVFISLIITYASAQTFGKAELVYEWTRLEYDWPTDALKQKAIDNKTFIPERNMVAGIKVYNNNIYLSVPRWFFTNGIPVTLAKVVTVNGKVKLRPYPNWAAQEQGNCNALQYVQGMEIDPNTGFMYVVDIGRIAQTLNLCPAKIVVYDLNTDSEIQKYELPSNVASPTSNFLNDITLDYVGGKVRFAYITDANDARIVVFDFQTLKSFTVKHQSMNIEGNNAEIVIINNRSYNIPVAVDGIAMSPDFKYVYYCSLAAYNLYQIPTSSLRFGSSDGIRSVGAKVSQSGGIGHGNKHLYYGSFGENAVYFWNLERDMANQKLGIDKVTMKTQTLLVRNDSTMQWQDTFAFDNLGWIWFVSNRLQLFRENSGLPNEGDAFMRIWKVFVNEAGNLYKADVRTQGSTIGGNSSPSMSSFTTGVGTTLFLILSYLLFF
uniref:Bee-milk protein n=1 Tax=Arion vulgaris TaxID=1028688 RepID=A0A0B7ARG0_9EUPU